MEKIAVIGSGSIGPDLCYGFATALSADSALVYLHDISETQLQAGMERIRAYLTKALDRGKLTADKVKQIENSIVPTVNIGDLKDCSYVMEAATENLNLKRKLLDSLENVVAKDCLIGFATSGIPRRDIVKDAKHPERCFVNHPFYPAWRSLPIEIVVSENKELSQQMINLIIRLGKVPIVTKDVHCFAADDVFCNFECEAFRLVEDQVANIWQIDRIINERIGGGGPFRVADMTRGNLLIDHCQQMMVEGNNGNKWFQSPAILLNQGNELWRKKEQRMDSSYDEVTAQKVMDRILAVLFARTFHIIDHDICSPSDTEWLLRNSLGFSVGIFSLAEKIGMAKVKELCLNYQKIHPDFPISISIMNEHLPKFYEHLHISEIDTDGIISIFIRRPEFANALNLKTVQELSEFFEICDKNEAVKGIVFSGYGKGLAGADIKELAALSTAEECERFCKPGQTLTRRIERMSKPVVAAIRGAVLGGGSEMAMACWERVMEESAWFGQPEVHLGIIPGYGATQRLPRLVGLQKAYEIMANGRPVKAKEAVSIKWAYAELAKDSVAGAKELIRNHIAGRITLKALSHDPFKSDQLNYVDITYHSLAIDRILRKVMITGLIQKLDEGLEVEAKGFGECRTTQDMAIGMANFMQNGPIPTIFLHK